MTQTEETIPSNRMEAYRRIQSIAKTRTQVELAEMLGIRQSSISDALRRGEIPNSWLVKLLELFNANPTWIKTGEGPQFLQGVDEMPPGPKLNRQHLVVTVEKSLVSAAQRIVDEVMTLATSPVVYMTVVSSDLSRLPLVSDTTANHILKTCHPNGSFLEGNANGFPQD